MSIEVDLFSHLSNDTGIVSLVAERIYPLLMPQDSVMPVVVCTIVNNKELQAINSREPYGFDVLVQVDCYSKDFDEALALKGMVQSSMHSFIHMAHGLNSRSAYESETELFRQLIEFNLKG